ncbi:MAG: hypothetical protein D6721_08880 [Gammaproteobacteria bacterium]|nr:MAG: hypothetical protein D6721_08880 [Gammaproteobacteria bacterium]
MRFHQLAVGAVFTYQGRTYVKTGPLTAAEREGGRQRCIPRSAPVVPADVPSGPPDSPSAAAARAEAVDAFCATVTEMIETLCGEDAERRGYYKGRLEEARRRLLAALEKHR